MTTGNVKVGSHSTEVLLLKSWSGADDPKKRAENPYTMTSIRNIRTRSKRYRLGVYQDSPLWYDSTDWNPWVSNWDANAELALLSKLADQLRDGSPNLGANLGEWDQIVSSFRNLMSATVSGWRSFRRGRFGDAFRHWSRFGSGGGRQRLRVADVSDAHLALTYGWCPLAQDIKALCDYIEARNNPARSLIYRQSKHLTFSNVDCSTVGYFKIPASGRLGVSIKYTLKERLSAARSMGLLNPVAVAWELVPFSFVVDWFVPIGTYLDALGLFPFLDGSYVRTMFSSAGASYHPATWTDGYYVYVGGGVEYRSVQLDRRVGTNLKVPRPSVKAVRSALSLVHVENAAALVWSGIKSLRAI